jgi:phosphate transport system substrate-binding protein
MRRLSVLFVSLVLVLAFAVACTPTATPSTFPTNAATSAAKTTVASTTAPTAVTGKFTAAGSTSLQPLAEKLSAAYMTVNTGAEITIQGGGSGVGVKSAQDGTAELGMVSRALTDAEKPGLNVYTVAKDAIVVIVNPDVAVSGLTKVQIQNIFSGTITNWKEVGGPDKPIIVVSREEGSGTRTAFQDMVMAKGAVIVANAILQSSNGAILSTVSTTPDSISYLSLGFVDKTVKVLSIDGVEGTLANAISGKYPVVRPLSFISKGEISGAVKAFIDWALGPDGQKIVTAQGYISSAQ